MGERAAEVLVLGAGIAGASLAYHLARRGVAPVVVFDPGVPGAGATGRAAGIVSEAMWDRWDTDVVRETRNEYRTLAERADPGAFRTNGFLRWASSPTIAATLRQATDRLRGWGVRSESIGPEGLDARVPSVRPDGIEEVTWHPDDAVVTPSSIAGIYVAEARRLGVDFLLGSPARRWGLDGERWTVEVPTGSVRARRAVVAAGAWSKRLFASCGVVVPLVPYRTQAALLTPSPPAAPLHPSVHDLDADVYARPEDGGRVLAGNGTEGVEADPDRFQQGGDGRFTAHLAETFEARFPGWREAVLNRAWAGVCTATPDRRPLIGPVPERPGLYCLAGFNGFGVMRAGGASARLARALSEGGEGEVWEPLRPVLPGRFGTEPPPFAPKPGFTLEAGPDPKF